MILKEIEQLYKISRVPFDKARGKCVKLLIKLRQTNEFDGQFDAFALTIKRDFFRKMKKEEKNPV